MSNPVGMYNIRSFLFKLQERLQEEGFSVEVHEMKVSRGPVATNRRVSSLVVSKNGEVLLDIDATDPDAYFCSVHDSLDRSEIVSGIESGDLNKVLENLKAA